MRLSPYIIIARPDYWANNVFIIPGVVLALLYVPGLVELAVIPKILAGIVCACLVASSNYVLNEILDAASDKFHPEKASRPIPSGQVRVPLAYLERILLALAGFSLAFTINHRLGFTMVAFWVAGSLYNVPPIRLKDKPYLDVVSESVNNPIRLYIGWYATGHDVMPPLSVTLAYWMFGAFLMGLKRFAEYRQIGDPARAASYRNSFRYYTEERLLESVFFYAALFSVFSGFFIARYQAEVILATPMVAMAMAYYMHLAFKPASPVQHPERLYRQKKLMILVVLAFLACVLLLLVDIPSLHNLINPRQLLPEHGLVLPP